MDKYLMEALANHVAYSGFKVNLAAIELHTRIARSSAILHKQEKEIERLTQTLAGRDTEKEDMSFVMTR